jgi:hypothetical protein
MGKQVLAPFQLWESALHALALLLSLAALWFPQSRTLPMRLALVGLLFFFCYRAVLRLKRAGGLKTPMSELSQHLPAHFSFAEHFGLIATTLCAVTQWLAF